MIRSASLIILCRISPAGLISFTSPALSPAARHISSKSPVVSGVGNTAENFGDCSRDPGFDMDRAGDHFYTTGPNHFFPREPTMFGPGAYVPDSTEGIVDVKDLPVPQLGLYSRN